MTKRFTDLSEQDTLATMFAAAFATHNSSEAFRDSPPTTMFMHLMRNEAELAVARGCSKETDNAGVCQAAELLMLSHGRCKFYLSCQGLWGQ